MSAYKITEHKYDMVVVGAGGAGLRATFGLAAKGLKTVEPRAVRNLRVAFVEGPGGVRIEMVQGRTEEELIGRWDREEDLSEVTMPALIACGRHDTQCPIAASLLMAERIPRARLVVFDDSNHFPFEEEPEAFHRAIFDFAATLEG